MIYNQTKNNQLKEVLVYRIDVASFCYDLYVMEISLKQRKILTFEYFLLLQMHIMTKIIKTNPITPIIMYKIRKPVFNSPVSSGIGKTALLGSLGSELPVL